MTISSVHFKHSTGQLLTLTVMSTPRPPTALFSSWRHTLLVRGMATGLLFLCSTSMPVTKAKINGWLRSSLRFCNLCPKQFKSHSLRTVAAATAAARGMSDSQIRLVGRWPSDAWNKKQKIRCSQRLSALWVDASVEGLLQCICCCCFAACCNVSGHESAQICSDIACGGRFAQFSVFSLQKGPFLFWTCRVRQPLLGQICSYWITCVHIKQDKGSTRLCSNSGCTQLLAKG